MSEVEQEQTQEPDAQEPDETLAPVAPDAEDEEAEAHESEEVEGQQGEPEEPSLEAQRRAQQAATKRINTAKAAYAKKLVEILGAEFEELLVCPRCSHDELPFGGIPGFIIPPRIAAVPPDLKNDVLASMGEQGDEVTMPDPYSRRCEICDGAGYVLTGSRMGRYATAKCIPCEGRGWLAVGDERRLPANREQVIPPSPSPVAAGNGHEEAPPPNPNEDLWGTPKGHPDYGMHPMYREGR